MNRNQLKALKSFLERKDPVVDARKAFVKTMLREIGSFEIISGNKLKLSYADYRNIENFYRQQLLTVDIAPADDRVATARNNSDEKLAKQGVFESFLNFAGKGRIPLVDGSSFQVPSGGIFSCRQETLDISRISCVVLVENGAMLTHAWDLASLLPEPYAEALILYRGHGENVRLVKELISSLGSDVRTAGYFDYDAAGMRIADEYHKLCPLELIVPDRDGLSDEVVSLNKDREYAQQQKYLKNLKANKDFSEEFLAEIDFIENNKLALTQENLLAHQSRLKSIRVNRYSA